MLLVDLLPDDADKDLLLSTATTYFEWWAWARRPTHADATLMHLDTLCEATFDAFKRAFGDHFANRVKFHLMIHVAGFIKRHGALPFHDDALAEAAHLLGVKESWRHTNHINVEPQMALHCTQHEALEDLWEAFLLREEAAKEAAEVAEAAELCVWRSGYALCATSKVSLLGFEPLPFARGSK